ncbi:MAG: thiaminase II, partial [Chloroflexota bacterium]|nr:thiaminase II [Chloroflexota bacterium]MEC9288413.1 thiaminase II [Chloroflexota bacterium]
MGLSDELKEGVASIWEQVSTHPFVTELGDNTLSDERFRIYFDQDYIF